MSFTTSPPIGPSGSETPTKRKLSLNRRKLVELMQDMNFGRIEQLEIRDAEPVLDPSPRILQEIKFGGENTPRPELHLGDFLLKSPVIELFAIFDELNDGVVDLLVLQHGLPIRMLIRQTVA